MSVKKNLTVATLAALLAVPAFGATNSKNAHAAYLNQNGVNLTTSEMYKVNPHSTGIGPGKGYHQAGLPWNSPKVGEQSLMGYYNGHSFHIPDNGGYIVDALDGHAKPSLAAVNAALYGSNNGGNNSNNGGNNNNNGNNNSSNGISNNNNSNNAQNSNVTTNQGQGSVTQTASSNPTQYSSKSELPQTGENNNTKKATAVGASLLTASAGLMALGYAKKHKELATETSTADTFNNINDGNNHNNKATKSDYHMIMSNTFRNISNNLKQM